MLMNDFSLHTWGALRKGWEQVVGSGRTAQVECLRFWKTRLCLDSHVPNWAAAFGVACDGWRLYWIRSADLIEKAGKHPRQRVDTKSSAACAVCPSDRQSNGESEKERKAAHVAPTKNKFNTVTYTKEVGLGLLFCIVRSHLPVTGLFLIPDL